MSTQAACIRASQVKANVESLQDFGEAQARRVLDVVPRGLLDEIEDASRVGWIPVEVDIELTEAVQATLGPELVTQWSQSAIRKSMQRPLLKPVSTARSASSGRRRPAS